MGRPAGPARPGQVATTIEASPPAVRDPLIERLRALAASLPSEAGLPGRRRARTWWGAGFEIGFHTRAHYQLQTLSDGELDDAMRDGRQRLTEATGLPLTKIAYPHGGADLRVAAAAAAAGFESGFTVRNAPVLPDADPLSGSPRPTAGCRPPGWPSPSLSWAPMPLDPGRIAVPAAAGPLTPRVRAPSFSVVIAAYQVAGLHWRRHRFGARSDGACPGGGGLR